MKLLKWRNQSPRLILNRIPLDDKELVRRERKVLYPVLSECEQYLTVQIPEIDMSISEESLEELQEAVESAIRVMWQWYVLNEDEKMTVGAMELRKNLQETYKVVQYDSS